SSLAITRGPPRTRRSPESPRLRGFFICAASGPNQSPPSKNDGQGRRGQVVQLPSSGEQLSERRRQIGGGDLVAHPRKSARRSERLTKATATTSGHSRLAERRRRLRGSAEQGRPYLGLLS